MIFEELSVFLKANLSCQSCQASTQELFFSWMKSRIEERHSERSNCTKLIQAEFRIVELKDKTNTNSSLIVPRSVRAARLLSFLNEYIWIIQSDHDERKKQKIKQKTKQETKKNKKRQNKES